MDRKAEIKKLLQGIERYSPEHRNALEEHILWQIHNNEYDLEANLALLRLYQFYPDRFNAEYAKLVLLKAMCNHSQSDFTLCKYLLNLEHLSKEPLSHVVELGYLLETCRFTEFWIKLKENPKMTASLSGFRESIYKCIFVGMHLTALTFTVECFIRCETNVIGIFKTVVYVFLKSFSERLECADDPRF
ncbi:unnamed protein product [Heterobilharzia americana]|nr:unnamed protein product [Heterobilharzia americana]